MIMPTHARTVKVITQTEFPRISEIIESLTYETSEYCIYLDDRGENVIGVYKITSEREQEPFARIRKLEEIAPNSPKRLIRDSRLDVTNPLQVLSYLEKIRCGSSGPEIVAFMAKHEHVTFAYCDRPVNLPEIQVIDVIPPSPSKLEGALKILQLAGVIPVDCPVTYHLINEVELLKEMESDPVLIPCMLSDLTNSHTRTVFSVDKNLHQLKDKHVHVLGCTRTQQAAQAHGLNVVEFKSMCPMHNLPDKGFFIAKCCMLRSGVELHKNENATGVVVPWGFNQAQIFEAGILLQDLIIKSIVY
ncbi:MAG: hypothetical protein E4H14_17265 [Candidatus Thorarchaeota archaeon]|nr:MAG: hypothetical protein E4H14_17265 [Candidatus Thorarchaeota archaeon]